LIFAKARPLQAIIAYTILDTSKAAFRFFVGFFKGREREEHTMSMEIIGKQIAALRKARGIKQEELANYTGVSTQAVSKWENGGVPDVELLPEIADFFGVSVDYLFDRGITDSSDLQLFFCDQVADTPEEDRFKLLLNYCWDMERAMYGKVDCGRIEDQERELGEQEQIYSSIMTDYGFTRMGIANRLQYFLLVPEIRDTEKALFDGIDYVSFFRDFSDEDVFHACVMLYKRDSGRAFTHNMLVESLGMEQEKAVQVLAVLEKYNLLRRTEIEVSREVQTVYSFNPTPSFVALLLFAREVIETPNNFYYYRGGRNKPYLK